MALVSMRELLDHAAANGYGIPAFNVNNLEQFFFVFTEATVPTGMKIGVWIFPWSVEMVPALAFPVVVLLISKNGDILLSGKCGYVWIFF